MYDPTRILTLVATLLRKGKEHKHDMSQTHECRVLQHVQTHATCANTPHAANLYIISQHFAVSRLPSESHHLAQILLSGKNPISPFSPPGDEGRGDGTLIAQDMYAQHYTSC